MPALECYQATFSDSSSSIFVGGNPLSFSLPLLSLQLLLVFLITRTLYFVLKPLKQPRVVSEIIGGIILGPSVLCRNDTFRNTVFPKRGTPVLDTIATFGLMYVIFLIGVKMDPGLLKRSGKKAAVIGLSGLVLPSFITTIALSSASRTTLAKHIAEGFVYVFVIGISFSSSSFAVLVPVLSDFKMLNSEIANIAMSSSMTNDGAALAMVIVLIVVQASRVSPAMSVWALLAIMALVVFVVCIVRPIAIWVIDQTPPGKPIDEGYIFVFLFIVLVVGLYSDIIGTNSFHGALMLGLVIPDGPPLGAALTEKIESMVSGLLLPLYYTLTGLSTDLHAIDDASGWKALQLIICLGWLGKLVGILLPSLYYKIPFRDALSLSLFMNSKGIVEVITYNFWRNNKLVSDQAFATLMLSAVMATAVSTPLAIVLYEPSRRYTMYKRRTVQHHRPDTELRILTCIHDQSHVPAAIDLLEAANATEASPLAVYVLHLVELVGAAAPLFIPHKLSRSNSNSSPSFPTHHHYVPYSDHIINAFILHEQRHPGIVSVHPFTTISPYASMHDEVCRMALKKRTSFLVLPFHKKQIPGGGSVEVNSRLRAVNRSVVKLAPCSIGVLVDAGIGMAMRTPGPGDKFIFRVGVFFLGGSDDREALSLASRMVRHPGVSLTIMRFLPSRSIRDNPAERKLDVTLVEQFRQENRGEKRVAYRESLVKDMVQIVEVIRAMDDGGYDLFMVGMRHRVNTVVSEGVMTEWNDCPELGVVGDFLASSAFVGRHAVLVVKQQDLLSQDSGIRCWWLSSRTC